MTTDKEDLRLAAKLAEEEATAYEEGWQVSYSDSGDNTLETITELRRLAASLRRMADGMERGEPVAQAREERLREALEHLVDVYKDGLNNAPEDRCYTTGALSAAIADAEKMIATPPEPVMAQRPTVEQGER